MSMHNYHVFFKDGTSMRIENIQKITFSKEDELIEFFEEPDNIPVAYVNMREFKNIKII